MYQLFCDSNCELWHTEIKKLGLEVIRMPYVLDGQEYYYDMGENTDFAHFFKRMKEGAVPTTSAINEQNYIDYFEPFLKDGKDIYYITFSHQLSATFNGMDKAILELKERYPDREIRTFDTKSISLGAGFQVYYAAKKYVEGATMDELDAFLSDFVNHVNTYFIVDDLIYLKRGGRISALTQMFGKLLGINPVINILPDGTLKSIGKVKGSKRIFGEFIRLMKSKNIDCKNYHIDVLQADCEDMAKACVEAIKAEFGSDVVVKSQMVGPVIGSHCGPGTLGVVFYGDQR